MHKPFSASNISNSLSTKRKTRKQSKDKPSKTLKLPLNVTEDFQAHHKDYIRIANYVRKDKLLAETRKLSKQRLLTTKETD